MLKELIVNEIIQHINVSENEAVKTRNFITYVLETVDDKEAAGELISGWLKARYDINHVIGIPDFYLTIDGKNIPIDINKPLGTKMSRSQDTPVPNTKKQRINTFKPV
ncbi:hypothetical protein [Endozoicomonas sp. ONNA1]|uniref:hypothetical protein n=1 Tax=Endozoicomonas sp. ONNA1 TaxID=2828740 RepID=UPI0021492210|nr:hypothetical protein [Endozoicomonas sp. ONNA1]